MGTRALGSSTGAGEGAVGARRRRAGEGGVGGGRLQLHQDALLALPKARLARVAGVALGTLKRPGNLPTTTKTVDTVVS